MSGGNHEKSTCFNCKHFFDCEVYKLISSVEDKIDEGSEFLNEYFIEDVKNKLDNIFHVLPSKCRDFDFEERGLSELLGGITKTLTTLLGTLANAIKKEASN